MRDGERSKHITVDQAWALALGVSSAEEIESAAAHAVTCAPCAALRSSVADEHVLLAASMRERFGAVEPSRSSDWAEIASSVTGASGNPGWAAAKLTLSGAGGVAVVILATTTFAAAAIGLVAAPQVRDVVGSALRSLSEPFDRGMATPPPVATVGTEDAAPFAPGLLDTQGGRVGDAASGTDSETDAHHDHVPPGRPTQGAAHRDDATPPPLHAGDGAEPAHVTVAADGALAAATPEASPTAPAADQGGVRGTGASAEPTLTPLPGSSPDEPGPEPPRGDPPGDPDPGRSGGEPPDDPDPGPPGGGHPGNPDPGPPGGAPPGDPTPGGPGHQPPGNPSPGPPGGEPPGNPSPGPGGRGRP